MRWRGRVLSFIMNYCSCIFLTTTITPREGTTQRSKRFGRFSQKPSAKYAVRTGDGYYLFYSFKHLIFYIYSRPTPYAARHHSSLRRPTDVKKKKKRAHGVVTVYTVARYITRAASCEHRRKSFRKPIARPSGAYFAKFPRGSGVTDTAAPGRRVDGSAKHTLRR